MPRPRSQTAQDIVSGATECFWRHGYGATSLEQLVTATGASRHGLYKDFDGKDALFAGCLDHYALMVVTPAITRCESSDSDIRDIAAYFEIQIGKAEAVGLPGPGCLIANTATEVAPHVTSIAARIQSHNTRLQSAFAKALANTAHARGATIPKRQVQDLALTIVIFANGLWSHSRSVSDAGPLRAAVRKFMSTIDHGLGS